MSDGTEAFTVMTPRGTLVLWATGHREELAWHLYCGDKIDSVYLPKRIKELEAEGYRVVPTLVVRRT